MATLRDECITLDGRFATWQSTRITEFKPIEVAQLGKTESKSDPAVGYWPGTVDTYFDLYVAGVWNIFRAARLQLIALNISLSASLGESYVHQVRDATSVVEDIIASVPYHLTENLPAFVYEARLESSTGILVPGRFLGGLLLVHPLYIASHMGFLPGKMREYLRACLLWIGSRMGIGQATVLANVSLFRIRK